MKRPVSLKTRKRRVSFCLEAPQSREVSVAGSFNGWNPRKHPMRKTADGRWEKSVILEPGTYEYKFFADGRWVEDFRDAQQCPNCFGTSNNIVVVST